MAAIGLTLIRLYRLPYEQLGPLAEAVLLVTIVLTFRLTLVAKTTGAAARHGVSTLLLAVNLIVYAGLFLVTAYWIFMLTVMADFS